MMKLEHDGKKSPEQIGLAGLKSEILAKPPIWRLFMTSIKYFQHMKNSQQLSDQGLRKILGNNVYTSA